MLSRAVRSSISKSCRMRLQLRLWELFVAWDWHLAIWVLVYILNMMGNSHNINAKGDALVVKVDKPRETCCWYVIAMDVVMDLVAIA